MKDAANRVAVNGYIRTDRGPFHATQRWFNRASPNGIRAVATEPPLASKAASAGVYDDATSRWTDCNFNQSGVTSWTVWTYLFVSLSAFISDCTFLPS